MLLWQGYGGGNKENHSNNFSSFNFLKSDLKENAAIFNNSIAYNSTKDRPDDTLQKKRRVKGLQQSLFLFLNEYSFREINEKSETIFSTISCYFDLFSCIGERGPPSIYS